MENIKIIKTKDGSDTIYLKNIDETYHSIHGAYSESEYVFIRNGFYPAIEKFCKKKIKKTLALIEIGFGTGLNAMLTYEQCVQKKIALENDFLYISLEPNPLPAEVIKKINHKDFFDPKLSEEWEKMHHCPWEKIFSLKKNFFLLKTKKRLEDFSLEHFFPEKNKPQIILVYFDGFAPSKEKKIWSLENFEKLAKTVCEGCILVSYSANNSFRKNLIKANWQWKSLPGALQKREMTFAELSEKEKI